MHPRALARKKNLIRSAYYRQHYTCHILIIGCIRECVHNYVTKMAVCTYSLMFPRSPCKQNLLGRNVSGQNDYKMMLGLSCECKRGCSLFPALIGRISNSWWQAVVCMTILSKYKEKGAYKIIIKHCIVIHLEDTARQIWLHFPLNVVHSTLVPQHGTGMHPRCGVTLVIH
jgi:hypothetical protein